MPKKEQEIKTTENNNNEKNLSDIEFKVPDMDIGSLGAKRSILLGDYDTLTLVEEKKIWQK